MKIIAELGSNWKSLNDCLNSIHLAKAIGADVVKFQLYSHEELYGFHGEMPGTMPAEWLPSLAAKAKAVGIEFMCSAFSVKGLRLIDPYIKTHKLASSEACHVDMLAELKSIAKPVLISTGGQVESDIRAIAKSIGPIATFMYCESAYPAHHIDFRKMKLLHDIVKKEGNPNGIGFSDHSKDILAIPLAAAHAGATIIEKHFNPHNYRDTADAFTSIDTDDFKAMINAIHGRDEPKFVITRDEIAMTLRYKRRLIATQIIFPGEALEKDINFGIFRSKCDDTMALHPARASAVNGKICRTAKKPGDPIKLSDYD